MSNKLLVDTNPYLKDRKNLAEGIAKMVKISSAVEGIDVDILVTENNGEYEFTVLPASQKDSA